MKATKAYTTMLLTMTLAMTAMGCAQVPPKGGFDEVQSMVSQRTGQRVYWRQGSEQDNEIDQAIGEMLKHELTAQQAVSIALLNNRQMQATYEELGITQAQVVQAGLLKNPSLGVLTRWPSRAAGTGANVELDLIFDFLDLALLPMRKQMAQSQFEQVRLEVAHAAITLVGQVQEAYYNLQAAGQIHTMRMMTFEASDASYELASRMYKAGNISLLALEREQGLLEQSRLEAASAKLEVMQNRQALAKLLGLYGQAMTFEVQPRLSELPADEPDTQQLETLAIQNRLDLAAAVLQTQLLSQSLGITKNYRFLLISELGVQGEREFDGTWLTGPQLNIELPIFDQKQAQIAKAQAQLRQSEQRLWALAVEIRADVRAAQQRMLAARQQAIHYRDVVIPLRESIVKHTTEKYNYMLVGVFEAIAAREDEYQAYQQYIQSVRDYWIAKAQLDTAAGGRVPLDSTEAKQIPQAPGSQEKPAMPMEMNMNMEMDMDKNVDESTPSPVSTPAPEASGEHQHAH